MNRLAKACLEAGLIGAPNFALQLQISPGSRIVATAWRHRLAMGGVLLDVAIHTGYVLEYLLGPIESVCARAQIVQSARAGKDVYGNQVQVQVDSEDCFSAVLEFTAGVQGHWTAHFASPGETQFKRLIIGSEGTLNSPADRSGMPVEVQRGNEVLQGEELVAAVPHYHLNEIETRLFGERPAGYHVEGPVTDRRLIAAEMHDFVAAIRNGGSPEADGAAGLRSLAIIYAILESAFSQRPVTVEEVLAGCVHAYQDRVAAAQLS